MANDAFGDVIRTKIPVLVTMVAVLVMLRWRRRQRIIYREPSMVRNIHRNAHMYRILDGGVHNCVEYIPMTKDTFLRLCYVLRERGHLRDTIHVSVEEQVVMFMHIIGHHSKNRSMKINFIRSGATVSRYFNAVLQVICQIKDEFVKQPGVSLHPDIEFNPHFFPYFKDCIGFLDGTHIDARVPIELQSKFRGRKEITQNVLTACDPDLKFVYVLAGWEGSANDYLVLKDAQSRPAPCGLSVPPGKYYLVDAGYTTTEEFIAPYRKVRYHLKEYEGRTPQSMEELFNFHHSQLRTRIERAFGILKSRLRILDSRPIFYPLVTQVDLVLACYVLHNFIKVVDPTDAFMDQAVLDEEVSTPVNPRSFYEQRITSQRWRAIRDKISQAMWRDYNSRVL